jgi:SAM-dependent methyltransferase
MTRTAGRLLGMGPHDPRPEQPNHIRINRESWTRGNASYTDSRAAAAWAQEEINWGLWGTPERELRVLPDVVSRDVIEMGCGTAYFSAWLGRRAARRVVGVDIT